MHRNGELRLRLRSPAAAFTTTAATGTFLGDCPRADGRRRRHMPQIPGGAMYHARGGASRQLANDLAVRRTNDEANLLRRPREIIGEHCAVGRVLGAVKALRHVRYVVPVLHDRRSTRREEI